MEGLRAVAVGLVVAFHAGVGALAGGYVGVDVFFVLSGFLITGLLLHELRTTGTVSLRRFWARRARRLLPMSTLVLVVTAVVSYLVLPPLDHGGLAGDVRAAALYVANWQFAAESTEYMADTDKSPVLHYWSLAVEEQFYVAWPLLLLLVAGAGLARRSPRVAVTRVALLLAVVGGLSFAVSALTTRTAGPVAYYGLHTRAWELAVGAALALAAPLVARVPRPAALAAGWAGLLAVVVAALAYDSTTVFPGAAAAVPVLGTALVVLAGGTAAVGTSAGVPRLLDNRALRYVGRISYGWYLWHWPCLVLAGALSGGTAGGDALVGGAGGAARGSTLATLAAVVVSFGLAALTHRLVEEPVRHARGLALRDGRSLALGAGLTAVAVVASLGAGVVGTGGTAPRGTESGPPLASAAVLPLEPGGAVPGGTPAVGSAVLTGPDATSTTLSPEEARADRPEGTDGCHVDYPTTTAGTECRFGAEDGSRVVALWGDSHAEQWFPAFEQLARERGWTLWFWGKAGCAPHGVHQLQRGRVPYTQCEEWRAHVLERMAGLPRLDLVAVGRVGGHFPNAVDASYEDIAPEERHAAWVEGSEEMFDALDDVASRVVVLRDTPKPTVDVPACLSEDPGDLRGCDFPRDGQVVSDEEIAAAEQEAARAHPSVGSVRLTLDVCPTDPCPAVTRDGVVMYRDDDHLTASFSARLSGALGRELTREAQAG
nr:acyltransferase family protein [Vallicoccus soli]